MSNIRILLVGDDCRITSVGNALFGNNILFKNKEVLELKYQRTLEISGPLYNEQYVSESSIGVHRLRDEFMTDISTNDYHAVVFTMEISPFLNLSYTSAVVKCMLEDHASKNLIRKKGIIVVIEADRFTEGQATGKITVPFLEWMRRKTGIDGTLFQEVQERCLLFDTNGTQEVLDTQCVDLVNMIDARILGGKHYTYVKFNEAEQRSIGIQEQISELRDKVAKQILEIRENSRSQFNETAQRLHELEIQMIKLKEDRLKKQTDRKDEVEGIRQLCISNSNEAAKRLNHLEETVFRLVTNSQMEQMIAEYKNKTTEKLDGLERQLKEMNEELVSVKNELGSFASKRSTIYEKMKSMFFLYPQRNSSLLVLALSVAILLLAMFVVYL